MGTTTIANATEIEPKEAPAKKPKLIFSTIMAGLVFVILGISVFYLLKNENEPPITTDPTPVTLKLKWLHQAQFAGNYVAKEKGFYSAEGLTLKIEEFSFESPTIDAVVEEKADFGITGADELIIARSKGLPLKAIAVIYKINPVCAYTLKDSGVAKPEDFIGKTVGIEKGTNVEILYQAMMKRLGIDRSQINEVATGYDANDLIEKKVDISTGYIINEPHQATEKGYPVNTMLMADYGVNMYADVVFVTEEMIAKNPELVEKFLRATLQGWQYAIENEEDAVNTVLRYTKDSTYNHQKNMLQKSIPLINNGEPLGLMKKEEWEDAQKILLEQKVLTDPIDIEKAFTLEFLEKIYKEK